MAKKTKPQLPQYPMSIETFRDVGTWELLNMKQDEPSAVNGNVRVKKYKITIEEVVEPIETVCERLQALWDESSNHHLFDPIKTKALQLGYELQGSMGNKKKSN